MSPNASEKLIANQAVRAEARGGAFRVRMARPEDIDALYQLSLKTGGGFTNLPPNRDDLARRVNASVAGLSQAAAEGSGELYMLVLEDVGTGAVFGTASLFTRLGVEWPFYSYKITRISQTCKELGKSLTSDVLHLVNDFDGCSEVGGLFLEPERRAAGAGRLIARSRYLFLAAHRSRFAAKIIADLRGYQAEDGSWPFWEGLGRHFFDMEFEDADRFNSLHGNQFIADLMPKYPIYARLLPPAAQAAIGRPHRDGERAYTLLAEEGFRYEGYVDIFDGGPTVVAYADDLKAVKDHHLSEVAGVRPLDSETSLDALVAVGRGADFRAARGRLELLPHSAVMVDEPLAACLGLSPGMEILHVTF
ncbi:arginine N-succinyltransferase [Pedomonas mirosovicensis]|uniref:arginine N-succinyltransferase n=1 Tax=Pedomonas mirosovicensis TaxID=2908641 RepID=UPI00216A33C4|nr:arginine N-succinyltransferase [Pedomonas mirosovicensis]MCH8684263.1 arginine N-succinyltransferase [Pedomonas mirosovicensis]